MANPLRTSNPALNEKAFRGEVAVGGEAMTLQGTVNKTGVLLLCVVATAAWTWGMAHSETPGAAMPWMTGGFRATQGLKIGVIAATGGIAVFYLVVMVLGLFHVNVGMGILYGGGPWAIAFSLFVVAIAALNLVLDFDTIETGVRMGAPRYMEWYGAFGLMVTLIWLYS